jgi:3-dehydroquinate synthase
MKNTKIIIKATSKSYPVYFGNGIISLAGPLIKKNIPGVKKICIITDKKIPSSLLTKLIRSIKNYNLKIYRLDINEKNKNLNTANKIIQELLKSDFNRSDCIVALGGGIVGDLSAFISSITKRGLKFINIPTTLLSQSDAAIGGKSGVNSVEGKNLIGTFYQPDFVLTDLLTLNSLPQEEMVCGYSEILKHSLIMDRKFFIWLIKNGKKIINNNDSKILKRAVIKSCKLKSKIINKDEKETNLRMILNFGHTFAHGFEATKNYSKKLNHGKAVLMGMMTACELSYKKKLLTLKDLKLIKKHYLDLKLPMNIKEKFEKKDINKIIYFMKKDKKNLNNKINLILLKKIGETTKPNDFSINHKELKKILMQHYY